MIVCCTAHYYQVIDEDGCQQLSHEVGTYLLTELAKLRDECDVVGDVRGKGLMIGVEMVKDKVTINALLSLPLVMLTVQRLPVEINCVIP
jgi:4-aminobutyrate aminotransferase-like enzyme